MQRGVRAPWVRVGGQNLAAPPAPCRSAVRCHRGRGDRRGAREGCWAPEGAAGACATTSSAKPSGGPQRAQPQPARPGALGASSAWPGWPHPCCCPVPAGRPASGAGRPGSAEPYLLQSGKRAAEGPGHAAGPGQHRGGGGGGGRAEGGRTPDIGPGRHRKWLGERGEPRMRGSPGRRGPAAAHGRKPEVGRRKLGLPDLFLPAPPGSASSARPVNFDLGGLSVTPALQDAGVVVLEALGTCEASNWPKAP